MASASGSSASATHCIHTAQPGSEDAKLAVLRSPTNKGKGLVVTPCSSRMLRKPKLEAAVAGSRRPNLADLDSRRWKQCRAYRKDDDSAPPNADPHG